MTHSVQYDLTSELSALFSQQLTGEGDPLAAIKIAIDFDAENFALASSVPLGADVPSDFAKVKATLKEDTGAYIVFRMLRGGENAPWALMSFVPDDAPVKQKMLYSSAKDALRKKLGQDSFVQEFHWSHLEDVSIDGDAGKMSAAEQQHIMTEAEKMTIYEDTASAAEAAAGKVKSAGIGFPLEPEASAKITEFASGGAALVVLEIISEKICLKKAASSATTSDMAAALPAAEACYCLFRFANDKGAPVVFLLCCPDDAPARSKMLHASSKGSMVDGLVGFGITVDKNLETSDPADVTEAWLTSEIYASEAAPAQPTVTTKAAPRGGRKLVKKRE